MSHPLEACKNVLAPDWRAQLMALAPSMSGARHLAALPVMYAVTHRSVVELAAPPERLWAGIWAGSATVYGAVRDCWNAGLRGHHLKAPEDWSEPWMN